MQRQGRPMSLDELTALHSALTAVLAWPDVVRAEMARWLAAEATKPNGRDPHPPPIAPTSVEVQKVKISSPPRSPTPYAGKARAGKSKAAERKLIEAMETNPGLSVAALAKAAAAGRSATGERLRKLAARGAIEKDGAGRWRLVGEEASPPAGGPEPRPPQPPAG
jgi:hypothetical protein